MSSLNNLLKGNKDEVAGQLARAAGDRENEHLGRKIALLRHLPAELSAIVAGYSAIDSSVLYLAFAGKIRYSESFTCGGFDYKFDCAPNVMHPYVDETFVGDYDITVYTVDAYGGDILWMDTRVSMPDICLFILHGQANGGLGDAANADNVRDYMLNRPSPGLTEEEVIRRIEATVQIVGYLLAEWVSRRPDEI